MITRQFSATDSVSISFYTEININTDNAGKHYFTHGALLYALPIQAKEITGKTYYDSFTDLTYEPAVKTIFSYKKGLKAYYTNGKIIAELINPNTNKAVEAALIPFGKTVLRQVTF